jgi:N-acyl-D-amino-acid deacylase
MKFMDRVFLKTTTRSQPLALFLLAALHVTMSQAQIYDLVFRNARIIDGTGSPWYRGDVGIVGSRIVHVGSINQNATALETIEANDLYLSPGFIDSHTHDDVAILENSSHEFKAVQGITTIITGNCGFSNYPEGHLQIVQDHLSSLLGTVPPNRFFGNFSSFRASLTSNKIGVNVGSLVGHGPLRLATVGYDNREATDEEIEAMVSLLETQLSQGAVGLSLGLVYAPSSYAGLKELISLASVVQKYDRVVSAHVRSYEGGLISSVEEFLSVLRSSGAKGLLSHLQAAGTRYWNTSIPQALDMLENARHEGIDVAIDMYPYLAGSSTILQLLPPSVMSGGFEELLSNIVNNATFLSYLRNMTEFGSEPGWESKISLIGYENIVVGSVEALELKKYEGKSIVEGAIEMGSVEFDFLVHLIKTDEGKTNVIMFQQDQSDNYRVFQSRLQMIGSDSIPRTSGGKPHPRGFGSFPRVIGRYAKQDGIMSMEEAVRKSTSLTASRFGIHDRGLIIEGMMADLVLFSEDILDEATYEEPTMHPSGILGVWVNGVRVVGNDGDLISREILPGSVIVGGGEKSDLQLGMISKASLILM